MSYQGPPFLSNAQNMMQISEVRPEIQKKSV